MARGMSMSESGPARPKLRAVEVRRVERDGTRVFAISDPRRVSSQALLVAEKFAPFLALADGMKTVEEIFSTGLASVVAGNSSPSGAEVADLFQKLDDLHMLDNDRYRQETQRKLDEYRSAEFRLPALEGKAYPDDPDELLDYFESFAPGVPTKASLSAQPLKAIVSPHIDYERGGDTYAEIWRRAAPDLADVELAVIFGTDHHGAGPRLTLTRQSYATPWNILPTDTELVGKLARVLDRDTAVKNHPFADEFNHIGEHSIELASVWLNWAIGDQATRVLPVLCGSLSDYVRDEGQRRAESPAGHSQIADAMGLLQQVAAHRKTVFVAAADLAHVGPAFGDDAPAGPESRSGVEASDRSLMEAVACGDSERFLNTVRESSDRTRVCGLAPIYMTLLAAGRGEGEWLGYRQCPADEQDASFVSIAGALLFEGKST
jgi:hypothetical protein